VNEENEFVCMNEKESERRGDKTLNLFEPQLKSLMNNNE
jgi:hypothetical protein